MKEVDMYSTVEDAVKMVVANKVDLVSGSCIEDAYHDMGAIEGSRCRRSHAMLHEQRPGKHSSAKVG